MKLVRQMYSRIDHLVHELMKFGIVGGAAFLVDIGVFNVLRVGLDVQPIRSKVVSTVIATTVAYFGNRHWTFRHRDRSGLGREYALFFVFNSIGLAIAMGCLGISHYLLGLRSLLADNLSANGVGMVLGTLFRFWAYRKWVFVSTGPAPEAAPLEPVAVAAADVQPQES